MNLASVFKQTQGNAVNGRISPSLVEEAARAVEVIEVVFVRLAAPKLHVGNLKVAPEVARRETVGGLVVGGSSGVVRHPLDCVVVVEVVWVIGEELDRLGPQRGQRLGVVVQVDGEAVRLVVVVHVAEDVVVDIAEEVDVGFYAPVVAGVFEGRVLVEEAAVPTAHLVVRDHLGVLHAVLLQDLG